MSCPLFLHYIFDAGTTSSPLLFTLNCFIVVFIIFQNSSYLRLPAFITNSPLANYIRQDTSLLTNTLFLKIILWFALLIVFILIEFAAVYIVFSLFYVMYVNMRSGRDAKRPGELSAYSVFNPNCERIDGTLTAEQFEKELRHGIGST